MLLVILAAAIAEQAEVLDMRFCSSAQKRGLQHYRWSPFSEVIFLLGQRKPANLAFQLQCIGKLPAKDLFQ